MTTLALIARAGYSVSSHFRRAMQKKSESEMYPGVAYINPLKLFGVHFWHKDIPEFNIEWALVSLLKEWLNATDREGFVASLQAPEKARLAFAQQ